MDLIPRSTYDILIHQIHKEFTDEGKEIVVAPYIHYASLSPVRSQLDVVIGKGIGSCSFIACMEAIFRIHRVQHRENWSHVYYFNINEAFDHLHKKLSIPIDPSLLFGEGGTRIDYVLSYLTSYGVAMTTAYTTSCPKNSIARFDRMANRYKIKGYRVMNKDDAFQLLHYYPVIGSLMAYDRLVHCKKDSIHRNKIIFSSNLFKKISTHKERRASDVDFPSIDRRIPFVKLKVSEDVLQSLLMHVPVVPLILKTSETTLSA